MDPFAMLITLVVSAVAYGFVQHRMDRPQPVVDERTELMLLQLELRRLARDIQRVHDSDAPHQWERLQAATAAYDVVLIQLCDRLAVPTPGELPPLHPRERFEAESALMSHGMDW